MSSTSTLNATRRPARTLSTPIRANRTPSNPNVPGATRGFAAPALRSIRAAIRTRFSTLFDLLRASQADLVRARPDRPYAIGSISPFLQFFEGHFQATIEVRPAAITLSFSDPGEWAQRVKDADIKVICQVQTFEDADLAVARAAQTLHRRCR